MWAIEPSNPGKVKVYGPGVESGIKTNQPTHFTVDCRGAGSGKLMAAFCLALVRSKQNARVCLDYRLT